MTFATWSQTAASNTSVGGISTDGNVTLVNQIDNMFRGMMAELAVARDDGTIGATAERGYLHGLTISNNSGDTTNDIDIALGECATRETPYWKMTLASTLTKRLDAAWAVGSGNGGLDTGSIANTTYHVWLIARSDTGVVDALFSTSSTSPTMPANYDRKRRIGSFTRAAAAIVLFYQFGDLFRLRAVQNGTTATIAYGPVLLGLPGVPTGLIVEPILVLNLSCSGVASAGITIGSSQDGTATTGAISVQSSTGGASQARAVIPGGFLTDTSGQIYAQQVVSGTIGASSVGSVGWIDRRDRI